MNLNDLEYINNYGKIKLKEKQKNIYESLKINKVNKN